MIKFYALCFAVLFMASCSRSGHRRTADLPVRVSGEDSNVVKIEQLDGVYQIPVEINGIPMHFIFDTGASIISISETEAVFLYKQGKLSREDILGDASFSDANGNISEGTLINIKEIKIGKRKLENIRAAVVHNLRAPLLLGQSALAKFGKVTIDYQKMEIELK